MSTNDTAAAPAEEPGGRDRRRGKEPPAVEDRDIVDEELEESFPSSDPPSHGSPGLAR